MAIGFGIVGCGNISRFHAQAIAEVAGARLVGCFNRSPGPAEKLANEFGCPAFTRLDELLALPVLQIVTIATPSGAHLEPSLAAIQAGKHLLVEKPLEVTLARCDQLLRAAETHGRLVGTIFPSRFHAAARQLKQAVDQQRFGTLVLGDAYVKWFRTQAYYDSAAWRGTWELDGGGALMNQAIHSVDLLLWLMGSVKEVTAQMSLRGHERIAVEDTLVATLRFDSGALGVIEASTATFPGSLKRIEINGLNGTAVLEEESLTRWQFEQPVAEDDAIRARFAAATHTGGGAADPKAIGHHGHARLFEEFAQAVRTGSIPSTAGRAGRASVELILAIYQSAETGQAVSLPLKTDPVLKGFADRAT